MSSFCRRHTNNDKIGEGSESKNKTTKSGGEKNEISNEPNLKNYKYRRQIRNLNIEKNQLLQKQMEKCTHLKKLKILRIYEQLEENQKKGEKLEQDWQQVMH